MKNILFIVFILLSSTIFSQQLHVKYIFVRSPAVTLYENLYVSNEKVISIQDSLRSKGDNLNGLTGNTFEADAYYYISNIKDENARDFFYTEELGGEKYFIYDSKVKFNNWIVDKNEKKKIAGYTCYKATTNFRGSEIIAYYTPEIKYSAGPYKFFGLPGLILEAKVKNKPYLMWKAESVELDNKKVIEYKPLLNKYSKINIKEFVVKKDANVKKFNSEIRKNAMQGTEIKSLVPNLRFGVETHYEWE